MLTVEVKVNERVVAIATAINRGHASPFHTCAMSEDDCDVRRYECSLRRIAAVMESDPVGYTADWYGDVLHPRNAGAWPLVARIIERAGAK